MHYIVDYAAALAREAGIKPLRGAPDIKPLFERRHREFRIARSENPAAVDVWLYNTRIVRFLPDGTIIVSVYVSDTTRKALWLVLGERLVVKQNKLWIHTTHGWHGMAHGEEHSFRRESFGQLAPLDPTQRVKHVVDRKGKKAMLARFGPFRDYLMATQSLGGTTGFSQAHLVETLGYNGNSDGSVAGSRQIRLLPLDDYTTARTLAGMMAAEASPDDWAKAAMQLLAYRHYASQWAPASGPSPARYVTATEPATAKDRFEQVLVRAFRDEVFKVVPDTTREIPVDRHAGVFAR